MPFSLITVLRAYVTSGTFYPPLPIQYAEVAKKVIDRVKAGDDLSDEIILPQLEVLPRQAWHNEEGYLVCTLGDMVEVLHLETFMRDWGLV